MALGFLLGMKIYFITFNEVGPPSRHAARLGQQRVEVEVNHFATLNVRGGNEKLMKCVK